MPGFSWAVGDVTRARSKEMHPQEQEIRENPQP